MSHAKIGRFSKKQIFELPDGTHRLEPHLYVRAVSYTHLTLPTTSRV